MKSNKIIFYLSLAVLVAGFLSACKKKYPGDSYDFSDKAQKYIQLNRARVIVNGETVDTTIIDGTDTIEAYYHLPSPGALVVVTREGIPTQVDYTIEYASPSITKTLNGTHPKFTLNSMVEVTVEDSEYDAEGEVSGTLTLKSVSGADLRMGYPFEGDNTVVPFTAYEPFVIHEY
ncbi:MAG: hypothetical protein JNM21_17780 [Taibaiella sp.]|nr:hypothetical protein [Taibaiella sp.]